MKWIKDEEFIRDKVPMTKEEVRMLTCMYLNIEEDTKFLDIGAGTGSISIQAALLGGNVTAVESNQLAIELIEKNAEKFQLPIRLIHGFAPDVCPDEIFDSIFIGGNRGKMEEIISYISSHLKKDGSLVANFVTLDNAYRAKQLFKEAGYEVEIKLMQFSEESEIGILKAQNPIFLLRGRKE